MNKRVTENEQKVRFEKSKDAMGKTIGKGLPAKILIFNVEQLRAFFVKNVSQNSMILDEETYSSKSRFSWGNLFKNLLFLNLLTHIIFNCVLSVLSLKFTIKISLTKSHYSAALKWITFVHFHINKFGILSHFSHRMKEGRCCREDTENCSDVKWKEIPSIVIKIVRSDLSNYCLSLTFFLFFVSSTYEMHNSVDEI